MVRITGALNERSVIRAISPKLLFEKSSAARVPWAPFSLFPVNSFDFCAAQPREDFSLLKPPDSRMLDSQITLHATVHLGKLK